MTKSLKAGKCTNYLALRMSREERVRKRKRKGVCVSEREIGIEEVKEIEKGDQRKRR